jgi:hypothetical protein
MAVFLAGCDESAGKTKRDVFLLGGFVGPRQDWSECFSPAWDERVLAGPPRIPYLHMTEIRSRKWREQHGLTELQADDRVGEAFVLLDQMQSFYPVGIQVHSGDLRDALHQLKIAAPKRKPRDFEPDCLRFLLYVLTVLHYVHDNRLEVEKVDFVIEVNGRITKYIQEFHQTIARNLELLGLSELSRLVGELIPDQKDLVPLQVADLLCWYTARSRNPKSMSREDILRFYKLAHRQGSLYKIKKSLIDALAGVLLETA